MNDDNNNNNKEQPMKWEKIFANHYAIKYLIPQLYGTLITQ